MGCGQFICSRNALIALNILYILIAILLIAVAGYAKAIALVRSLAIIGGVIGCGVFLFLVACMGFIGAVKHHQICLFFYMLILFLLFLIQFSLAVALLAISEETQKELAAKGWDSASHGTRQDIQIHANCCSFSHWTNSSLSCADVACCSGKTNQYACCGATNPSLADNCPLECETCEEKIMKYSNTGCRLTGGVGLFISFTEVIGVWLSLRYRNQRDPSADPNHFL